jgi:membrane protein DedA with SNARE-associated domain
MSSMVLPLCPMMILMSYERNLNKVRNLIKSEGSKLIIVCRYVGE